MSNTAKQDTRKTYDTARTGTVTTNMSNRTHEQQENAASRGSYSLEAHRVQESLPWVATYPALQGVGVEVALLQKWPAGHGEHELDPAHQQLKQLRYLTACMYMYGSTHCNIYKAHDFLINNTHF